MGSIFGIAQSGLQAASLQLATSAHNVANALTGGFVPRRVELQEQADGGVTARQVPGNDPRVERRIDDAVLARSATDLVDETASRLAAAAAFRASLASLRAADEVQAALLRVKG